MRKAFPFRLTRIGLFYLALMALVLAAMLNSGVNLLYFAFGMMIGALVFSLCLSYWSLRSLHLRREFSPYMIAGEAAEMTYQLWNTKRYWPGVGVEVREEHPIFAQAPRGLAAYLPARRKHEAAQVVKIAAAVRTKRRGRAALDAIEVATAFPFGIVRCVRRLSVPQEMIVYPRVGVLNRHLALEYRESVESGAMTSNRRGGSDEFYGVREYRGGDNLRAIHWRSSARAGELMIREMAANAPPQLIVVLNLRGKRADDMVAGGAPISPFERAIELAAALICYGYYENFAVGLAVAGLKGIGPPAPHLGRDMRTRMLTQLAVIEPDDIESGDGIEFPNRVAGRAQWVIVTLHAGDPVSDLLPPGLTARHGSPAGNGSGPPNRAVLAIDAPNSASWIKYLTAQDAHRLLRQQEPTDAGRTPRRPMKGENGN